MQNSNRRFGALSSSVDPSKLSSTVTGVIISVSAFIVFAASHFFGFSISDAQVTQAASQIGEAVGSIVLLFGLLRKILVSVYDKVHPRAPQG